ncbi:MAG: hypothetical protein OXN17_01410 [Candidatus Poribacteria bacterium]|nr:hypothetical protein [Candidatus Poribacteria bacterium]MDE0506417.1 hypothetical protein [Candidatus Poribacteria bacterium]
MNPNKNTRQVLGEWINQNPDGWTIRTAKTIATETGTTEGDVKDYFEIAMADIHGGSPQDYFNCIASEIRKLLNEHKDVKEVTFVTGATMADVRAIKEEIDRPRREREAMGGWRTRAPSM